MVDAKTSLETALDELDRVAPSAPLLALGQTVFWDEPVKSGVALSLMRRNSDRKFIAGVHDTDYFAKTPTKKSSKRRFQALPHNDTTTKEIWSAAAEFSSLFGSETPIRREILSGAGVRLHRLESMRPGLLDSLTEAFGWRGLVSLEEDPPVAADMPIHDLIQELYVTLEWAIDETVACLTGNRREAAIVKGNELKAMLCDVVDHESCRTISDAYQLLLPRIYDFVCGAKLEIESTRTSHLLKFNLQTCHLPRFDHLQLFLDPETADTAKLAYNRAVKSTGHYELDRFGTGAIPFDVYIPGVGRGTLRLGSKGAVIETHNPQFLSYKVRPTSACELAKTIEDKFGPNCAIVGKALALIGMLAREHVFVFHEGASGYVTRSAQMHREIEQKLGIKLNLNPILRVKYDTWTSLESACCWLKLPEPFRRPFGAEEMCAGSFSERLPQVQMEQRERLAQFTKLRRPIDTIYFLHENLGGVWQSQAKEYEQIQIELGKLQHQISEKIAERRKLYGAIKEKKWERQALEHEKGNYFRSHIFEKNPGHDTMNTWQSFGKQIDYCIQTISGLHQELKQLSKEQGALSNSDAVLRAHSRRRDLEFEAELAKAQLIREAVICTDGLDHARLRPTGWQFPMVSPDSAWFNRTVETASCYLEPIV